MVEKKSAAGEGRTEKKPKAKAAADKPLTAKQEKFCQEFVATGNQSEAYRRSFNAGKMTAKTVTEAASRVMAECNVSARVVELQTCAAKRHELTVDDIVAELEEARAMGKVTKQAASMVSASMGKAKLLGMIIDRKDITVHGIIGGMTDEELGRFIDEIDVDSEDYADPSNPDDAA